MTHRSAKVITCTALVLFAIVGAAYAVTTVTVSGQAYSANKLRSYVRMPDGNRSNMTFTIKKSTGTKIKGYAIDSTVYYEHGPNDSVYHRTTKATAYTVFRNWGGGGYCPSKLVYRKYVKNGTTYGVLTKVYYFMAGE